MTENAAENITDIIVKLAEPVLADLGLELVEVQFRREKVGWVLRVIIYRPAGVTVDDCAKVSREIGMLLDVEDLIDQPYHLEVTSPGLDRPLKTARDFARHRGQKVKVVTKAPVADEQVIIGLIAKVDEAAVTVAVEGKQIAVPYERIAKAKLVIEF
ncbi:MAG: ribosome maturation factor RimP [Desulfobacteraceae bacterium]|nr:ribosome maturation factor RimP [Desulfobacteraceae bacterium]